MTDTPLLSIADLNVSFRSDEGMTRVLENVSFDIAPGEIVGLVGESGSGKSVTAMAVMSLLGAQGQIEPGGAVHLNGRNIADLTEREMLNVRGRDIGMIFQEPMTSLNPLMTVGYQIAEPLRTHLDMSRSKAHDRAVELLAEVGIPDPQARVDEYPHHMSGGMRQRIMIAMALACDPKLLIADEPTTALDVTIQAQILELMRNLRDRKGSGILLITHDLGVIAQMADRVVVMYAGQVAEVGPLRDLLAEPRHPYTKMLLNCAPRVDLLSPRLPIIPGSLPEPDEWAAGCRFHPRCPLADDRCRKESPVLNDVGDGHASRCHYPERVDQVEISIDVETASAISDQSSKGMGA